MTHADISSYLQALLNGEKELTVVEIAQKRGQDYHTLLKQFKGRPGVSKRPDWRVTETAYREWLEEGLLAGLAASA